MGVATSSRCEQAMCGSEHPSATSIYESMAIFKAANTTNIGSGEKALFWTHWWQRVKDITPNLMAVVAKPTLSTLTVKDGLQGAWIRDYGPNLNFVALQEFLPIWGSVMEIQFDPEVDDALIWTWEKDGAYSARSA